MRTAERAIEFLRSMNLLGKQSQTWTFPDGREYTLSGLLTSFATDAHEEIDRLRSFKEDALTSLEQQGLQIEHYKTNYERKCKEYADLFSQFSNLKSEKKEEISRLNFHLQNEREKFNETETMLNDAVRQLEEKGEELEAEKDLVAVQNKEIEQLQQLLKVAEETNKELRLKLSEFKGLFSDNGEVVED